MRINGLPVVDATKRLQITIKDTDVKNGKTKDPGACAAARACIRQLHCNAARVHLGRTYLQMGKKWVRFNTPEAIRAEIISFDRGALFQAGNYTLSPPQPSHRGNRKRQGSDAPSRGGKARAKPHVIHGVRAHGANR